MKPSVLLEATSRAAAQLPKLGSGTSFLHPPGKRSGLGSSKDVSKERSKTRPLQLLEMGQDLLLWATLTIDGRAAHEVGVGEVEWDFQAEVGLHHVPHLLGHVVVQVGTVQGHLALLAQLWGTDRTGAQSQLGTGNHLP